MKSRKTWLRFVALMGALALVAAACGSSGDDTTTTSTTVTPPPPGADDTTTTTVVEPIAGGTVSGYLTEPPFIDPQLTSDSEAFEVARLVFDGLTLYDPAGGAVIPGVARDWTANEDLTVWTFNLRDDVFFHNGRQVVAQDFVYGISRLADPDLASSVSYHGGGGYAGIVGFDDIVGSESSGTVGDELVVGLEAIDDLTLQFTLDGTNALLPKIVAHPAFSPVPQEVVEADPAAWGEMPIGNGPYKMREPWQHDVAITVDRFEDYWGTPGLPDTVEFRIFSTPEAAYLDVQAGNLDVSDNVPVELIDSARVEFGDRFGEIPSGLFQYMGFPNQTPPYDNPDIRKALTMAVDRVAINERILQQQTAFGFVPPGAAGAIDGECPACIFDPVAAKELFDSVGGVPGNKLTIAFNAGGGHEEWIEAVANDWRNNLGIEVDFMTLEWAAYLEFLGITGGPPAVEPFRLGWSWDYPSAYNFLAPLFDSESGDNFAKYSNPAYDALLQQAINSKTEEEAIPFMEEAQRILAEDMPVMPRSYGVERWVFSDNVSNVVLNDFGFTLWENIVVG